MVRETRRVRRKAGVRKAATSKAATSKAAGPKAVAAKAAPIPTAPRVRGPRRPLPSPPAAAPRGGRAPLRRRRWLAGLAAIVLVCPPGLAALYRVLPPPVTVLMIERLGQGYGLHKTWRPVSDISPDLVRSVIAAEDAHFCSHHGFDMAAMRAAAAHNARDPRRVRGGSTITQQTAKNVFLWPQRSYVRKGLEAGYTSLIEALWGKRRIMEVYLNVVEWGPGVYGAQAASERYFGHGADALSASEAARLAAILPDPLKWKAVRPGAYVARRSRRIGAAAQTVRADDLAACVLKDGRA